MVRITNIAYNLDLNKQGGNVVITLKSRSTHNNPLTGFDVPDESVIFFNHKVDEDEDNYYAVPIFATDNMVQCVYPKSEWICMMVQ